MTCPFSYSNNSRAAMSTSPNVQNDLPLQSQTD